MQPSQNSGLESIFYKRELCIPASVQCLSAAGHKLRSPNNRPIICTCSVSKQYVQLVNVGKNDSLPGNVKCWLSGGILANIFALFTRICLLHTIGQAL